MSEPALTRFLYGARDLRFGKVFRALSESCKGSVLDIGGRDFYRTAIRHGLPFSSWTVVEIAPAAVPRPGDPRVRIIAGDGCQMPLGPETFDSVLCIQVLEHVFTPTEMVNEIARVLKPGGTAILVVPQTANLHLVPDHYCNFTRYWVEEALVRARLELRELAPLGGFWSGTASRAFYFLLQSLGHQQMTSRALRRSPAFYVLLPFMWIFCAVLIPISLVLSIGDLEDEPSNHLVVARKPAAPDGGGGEGGCR